MTRDELIEANWEWACRVACAYARRIGVAFDDARSSAALGLVRAADSYDAASRVPFQGFAIRRIRGQVLDDLRASNRLITRGDCARRGRGEDVASKQAVSLSLKTVQRHPRFLTQPQPWYSVEDVMRQARLSPEHRATVRAVLAGRTYPDIARAAGVTETAISCRVRKIAELCAAVTGHG
jgi:RNA polymerase sigma factor (sigma-70 family)